MYRYGIVACLALFFGFVGGWKTQGWRLGKEIETIRAIHDKEKAVASDALRQAEQKYREQEVQTTRMLADAQEKRNEEIRRINARHATTVNSLRNRPERVSHTYSPVAEMPSTPEVSTPSEWCDGSRLYREYAEAFAREAALAAETQAELRACYTQYEEIRRILSGN